MTQIATGGAAVPDPVDAPRPAVLPAPAPARPARRGPGTLSRRADLGSRPRPRPRPIAGTRASDVYALAGSLVGAVSLTALIFFMIAPFSGVVGFVLISYVLFVLLYALVVSFDEDARTVVNRVAAVVVSSLGAVLLGALVLIVVYTFIRAWDALRHLNFYIEDLSKAGPLNGLTVGGAWAGIVGTLEMITIALVITIPSGLLCAVFLSELPGPYARFVRTVVDAASALPSIIAGLFVYATLLIGIDVFGVTLKLPSSGFAAALAISVMMLPIIVRAADVVLRLVAGTLKEASYAMGATQWRTVWHVVLPTARSGLTTAVILGTARGIGETSPVLLTAGYTTAVNYNPFDGAMVSLPLETFTLVKSPEIVQIVRGFGCAAILLAIVLTLFVVARALAGRPAGDLSPRQQRRRAAESRADLERFENRRAGRGGVGGLLGGLATSSTHPAATPLEGQA